MAALGQDHSPTLGRGCQSDQALQELHIWYRAAVLLRYQDWSPDSKHLAFCMQTVVLLINMRVYVVEKSGGIQATAVSI